MQKAANWPPSRLWLGFHLLTDGTPQPSGVDRTAYVVSRRLSLFIPESLYRYFTISELHVFEAIQYFTENSFLFLQFRMPFPIVSADPLRGQLGEVRFKCSDKC